MRPTLIIRKLSIGVLISSLAIIAFTVIINLSLFDEEPLPEVVDIINLSPMPLDRNNSYFSLMGIASDSKDDMAESGIKLIKRYRENRDIKHLDELTKQDYEDILGSSKEYDRWIELYPRCTSRREFSCLTKLSNTLKSIPPTNQNLQMMLKRFELIQKSAHFEGIGDMTIGTPILPFDKIMILSHIKLAYLYQQKEYQTFLRQLKVDMFFWKDLLVNGNMLITKMVAVAVLWTDLQYLSEFIGKNDLSEENYLFAIELLKPLTNKELDIGESFIFEAHSFYPSLVNMSTKELDFAFGSFSDLLNLLIQPNSTSNIHYENFIKPIVALSKLSASEFYHALKIEKQNHQKAMEFKFQLNSLYNLGGKMLLPAVSWSASEYISRMHDLNGMIRLVKLQIEIKQNAQNTTIETLIKKSKHSNLYTNQPVNFDSGKNTISFECLSKGTLCKVAL